jgi:hypothetical protein
MHLDPNNCVLLLNEMEAAATVGADPVDRRRHIVEITDEAARSRADTALNTVEGRARNLSAEERGASRCSPARWSSSDFQPPVTASAVTALGVTGTTSNRGPPTPRPIAASARGRRTPSAGSSG